MEDIASPHHQSDPTHCPGLGLTLTGLIESHRYPVHYQSQQVMDMSNSMPVVINPLILSGNINAHYH